jgi:hypothetical protein
MTAVAEVGRRVPRLPSAPLVAALHQARVTRGVAWDRLLSAWQLRAYYLAKAEGEVTSYMVRQLCAAIGRDPREVYGSGLPEEAAAVPVSVVVVADQRLPSLPLVEAIEARVRRVVAGLVPLTDRRTARGEAVREVFGEAGALLRAFQRARRCGWVTLEAAEALCDAFGWHPRELWGEAYDAAALAGCEPDFDPWEGMAA